MINALNNLADNWLNFQLTMLWQVTALIAIVWLIDLIIRKWAWPQLRYALWLLILVKLILPPTLTSPTSFTAEIPAIAKKSIKLQFNQPPPTTPSLAFGITPTEIPTKNTMTYSPAAPAAIQPAKTLQPSDTTPHAAAISWKSYSFLTWLAGMAILSAWLITRLTSLRREHLKNTANKLPERFNDLLTSAAQKLKLKNVPQVILTDKVCCPAVFGLFKPILLMPADKLKNLTRSDTEHILLHELAHIKRGDLLIHAIYMTLQIAYWFNPLLWLIRKHLQSLRELCCDATVAKILRENTTHYRRTLLETARQLLAEPTDPGLGLLGLFENSNRLFDRLKWLEKKTWKNRPLRIVTIFLLICIMATCVIPMAKFDPGPPSLTIKGTVTDAETGNPIAGARIFDDPYGPGPDWQKIESGFYDPNLPQWGATTDANGNYAFLTWHEHHSFKVKADGYKDDRGTLYSGHLTIPTKDIEVFDFTLEKQYDQNPKPSAIPEQFVGHWKGQAKIVVNWTKQRQLGIDITINPDGSVIGRIGDSEIKDARFSLKSDFYLKWLKHTQRYIITGQLSGPIIKSEDISRKKLTIGLDITDANTLKGQVGTSGFLFGAKKLNEMLIAHNMVLKKASAKDADKTEFKSSLHEVATAKNSHNLLIERRDILQEKLQTLEWQLNVGRASLEQLNQAKIDLLRVESELSETPQKRIAILEQIVALYKDQEKRTQLLSAAGRATQDELYKAKLLRLEAEAELAKAKATDNKQQTDFKATLPNGVTVELVGTCQYTNDGVSCYRPDGNPLGRKLKITKWNQTPKAGDVGIMLKVSGPEDISFSYHKILGAKGWEGSCQVIDENGKELEQYQAALTRFDANQIDTTAEFGVAAGEWETIAKHHGTSMGINNNISFTKATQTEKDVQIYTTDTLGRYVTQRIVAIDNNGKLHPWKGRTGSVSNSQIRQSTGTFPSLRLEQIKEFQFQTRPYQWIKFKNISLKPNFKTNVQIEIENEKYDGKQINKNSQPQIKSQQIKPKVVGIGPGWQWLKRVVGSNYRGSIGGYGGDKDKGSEYFRKVLSWAKPGDTFIMMFSFDEKEYDHSLPISEEFKDLLPEPWPEISRRVKNGQSVELKGKTRGLDTILLAAPTYDKLGELIKNTELLKNFKPNNEPELWGTETKPEEIIVEVLVDDTSELWIEKDRIYWKNLSRYAKPGLHGWRNEPTWVNGKKWIPLWRHPEKDRGFDTSLPYYLPVGALNFKAELLTVGKIRDAKGIERGAISSRMEKGAFVVLAKDLHGGPRWYKIRLYRTGQPVFPIEFETSKADFQLGDQIQITELLGTAQAIKMGETYTVKGKYTLASHNTAMLHIYATNGETSSEQGPLIERGGGEFSRTFTMLKPGELHLSFYPAGGGNGFGGIYFRERKTIESPIMKTDEQTTTVDITPDDFDIRLNSKRGTCDLVVSIHNQSSMTLPKFKLKFYRHDPASNLDEAGNTHSGWHEAGPIEPGNTWNESTRDFHLPDGQYQFHVILDYDNKVQESNENNNTASLEVKIANGKMISKSVTLENIKKPSIQIRSRITKKQDG